MLIGIGFLREDEMISTRRNIGCQRGLPIAREVSYLSVGLLGDELP